MNPEVISALLAPFVVWGAVALAKKILPFLSGWKILVLAVPIISVGTSFVATQLLKVDNSFLEQTLFGLLSVFLNELSKNIGEAAAP